LTARSLFGDPEAGRRENRGAHSDLAPSPDRQKTDPSGRSFLLWENYGE